MGKLSEKLTRDQLNNMVVSFYNQLFFLILINSGNSCPEAKHNEYAKKAFDIAYAVLYDAYLKRDVSLFNRIYSESKRLCSGNITSEMKKMQEEFESKVSEFIQVLKVCIANNGREYSN